MTPTLAQAFDLPRREDITALGFVVRLSDDNEDAGVRRLVDEFLLWLREKSGPDFERAINQLHVLVDHADGARARSMR